MCEFFKPWRRKIGCVTLTIAVLFMAGWVRSFVYSDQIIIRRDPSTYLFTFNGGLLRGECFTVGQDAFHLMNDVQSGWTLNDKWEPVFLGMLEPKLHIDRQWRQFGFKYLVGTFQKPGGPVGDRVVAWAVPYWSLTVPMTLISFCLLLSKPRKSTSVKIAESTPAEGT